MDRDGTLIIDEGYLADPKRVTLIPGVIESLRRLQEAGFFLFIITNQSGVARGFFSLADMERVQARLMVLLKDEGIELRDWRFCPHHPDGIVEEFRMHCHCRKPEHGMIMDLAEEYQIDLADSWVIGDKDSDVRAGANAGCRTILLCGDKHYGANNVSNTCRPEMPNEESKLEEVDGTRPRPRPRQEKLARVDFRCQTITEAVKVILSNEEFIVQKFLPVKIGRGSDS